VCHRSSLIVEETEACPFRKRQIAAPKPNLWRRLPAHVAVTSILRSVSSNAFNTCTLYAKFPWPISSPFERKRGRPPFSSRFQFKQVTRFTSSKFWPYYRIPYETILNPKILVVSLPSPSLILVDLQLVIRYDGQSHPE